MTLMLAWEGFAGVLNQLDSIGFFAYVLPFLLIFGLVYAIINSIPFFRQQKGAGLIVSLAIGLLALQFDVVSVFFENIFPKVGIGLAILLVAMILAGAFISDEEGAYKWIFFAIGGIIFIVILLSSASDWSLGGWWFWEQYGVMIIVAILVIAAAAVIVAYGNKENKPKKPKQDRDGS